MKKVVRKHTDLEVYQRAFAVALRIHEATKSFPAEEKYALVDQYRRSSRSVCANLGEAWRKRRYRANWISKLGECEAEAVESQVWTHFAVELGYLEREVAREIYLEYEEIIAMLVTMSVNANDWLIKQS